MRKKVFGENNQFQVELFLIKIDLFPAVIVILDLKPVLDPSVMVFDLKTVLSPLGFPEMARVVNLKSEMQNVFNLKILLTT